MQRVRLQLAAILGGTLLGARMLLAQPAPDHLACSKVNDGMPKTKYALTISSERGTQTCVAKVPAKRACVQAASLNAIPTPPGGGPSGSAAGAFLCYAVKCPGAPLAADMQDQFGRRTVTMRGVKLFCAPARQFGAGFAPPTTTTTTLPGGQTGCTFSNGKCTGQCAPGAQCGSAVSDGSCECRSESCGNAGAPECKGFCTDPGEACTFDVTGCSCVRVP